MLMRKNQCVAVALALVDVVVAAEAPVTEVVEVVVDVAAAIGVKATPRCVCHVLTRSVVRLVGCQLSCCQ